MENRSRSTAFAGRDTLATWLLDNRPKSRQFSNSVSNEMDDVSMLNLNDFFYFVQVVDHGGFTAAGRLLRIPKSTLSHRIQRLETELGARLLNFIATRWRCCATQTWRRAPFAIG
jgi:hypothetical protein